MPLSATQSRMRARSSSSKRKRRRTGSRSARSSTSEAVRRRPARSISWATTPSTGLVWRSERSARRTRRSVGRSSSGSGSNSSSSTTLAGAERRLDQRGERLDVRAHHDHVARLQRVVLVEQVEDRVAQDLDLAGAAVAGVDLDAAVARAESGRGSGRPVGADVGLDAARAACRPAPRSRGGARRARASPSTSCISRASWPQEASRRLSASGGGGVVGAPDDRRRARRSSPTAPARGGGGRGARRGRRRARAARRGGRPGAGSGRRARCARGGRRARARRCSRSHAGSSRSAGLGSSSRCAEAAPELGLPRGLGREVDLAARPAAHHLRAVERVAVEQLGEVADGGESAGAAVGVVRVAQVDRAGCAATARRGTRRRPRAAATPRAAASHGSASGSIPDAVATASPTSRCGNGNSTFAHTPSARPGVAPRLADSRCVSQRSMPRVGTEMTSGAKGSGSGSARRRPRASTRPSARSARWICSMEG